MNENEQCLLLRVEQIHVLCDSGPAGDCGVGVDEVAEYPETTSLNDTHGPQIQGPKPGQSSDKLLLNGLSDAATRLGHKRRCAEVSRGVLPFMKVWARGTGSEALVDKPKVIYHGWGASSFPRYNNLSNVAGRLGLFYICSKILPHFSFEFVVRLVSHDVGKTKAVLNW